YDIDDLEEIMHENLRVREQALAQCRDIITTRSNAVMAKISPVEGRTPRAPIFNEPSIQYRPGWAFSGAAGCAG
ncbi:MAG TPA: hypothetical protein VK530_18995, partial [Candidatus Acidoferrum sp.]|nr:hypothetical protein [Candidatus Acidoferrum sp.]